MLTNQSRLLKTNLKKYINLPGKIKINARPRKFNAGDLVLLKNEKKEKTELTKKLSNLWLGSYEVISIISDTNTKILVSNRPITAHNNKIKLYNN